MIEDKDIAKMEGWIKEHNEKWKLQLLTFKDSPAFTIETSDSLISISFDKKTIIEIAITDNNNLRVDTDKTLMTFFRFGAVDTITIV